jgi:hypothetical protein
MLRSIEPRLSSTVSIAYVTGCSRQKKCQIAYALPARTTSARTLRAHRRFIALLPIIFAAGLY